MDGAIKFFKFWFSEEGAKQWILMPVSNGHHVDLSTTRGVDPGLLDTWGSGQCQTVYTCRPPGVVERRLDDCQSSLDTMMSGGSVDDAMAAADRNVQMISNRLTYHQEYWQPELVPAASKTRV
jgi:hypothetical protein